MRYLLLSLMLSACAQYQSKNDSALGSSSPFSSKDLYSSWASIQSHAPYNWKFSLAKDNTSTWSYSTAKCKADIQVTKDYQRQFDTGELIVSNSQVIWLDPNDTGPGCNEFNRSYHYTVFGNVLELYDEQVHNYIYFK